MTQALSGDSNLTLLSLCRLALGVGFRPEIAFSDNTVRTHSILAGQAIERVAAVNTPLVKDGTVQAVEVRPTTDYALAG